MMTLIALLCLGLAGWAAKLSLYTPPQYNWKQSFHFSLHRSHEEPSTDIYPPCLGGVWNPFDVDAVQKRHQNQFAHVKMFSFSQISLLNRLQAYLRCPLHIVSARAEDIASHVKHSSSRLLFVCEGEEVQELFLLLQQHPGMRDVLYGLIVIDPVFDSSWMSLHFDQDVLDTEANTPVPYIFCFSKEEKAVPTPKDSKTGWRSISAISLGAVDMEHPEISMAFAALFSAMYS